MITMFVKKEYIFYIVVFIIIAVMMSLFFVPAFNVYAAAVPSDTSPASTVEQGSGKFSVELKNPLTEDTSQAVPVSQLVGAIIKAILILIGSIALLIVVIAGLIWLTSRGNEEKITKARGALVWATLGLMAIFASYIVLNSILNILSSEVIRTTSQAVVIPTHIANS